MQPGATTAFVSAGGRICQGLDEPKQGEDNNLRMRPQRRQITDGGGIFQ